MKIALIAALVTPIAQPFVGGAQVLLHDLALGLARRGHQVTLFAASGSKLEAMSERTDAVDQVEIVEIPVEAGEFALANFQAGESTLATDKAFMRQSQLFLEIFLKINQAAPRFDIAHALAYDWPVFAFGPLSDVPVVHTLGQAAGDPYIEDLLQVAQRIKGSSQAVTVSRACAATYKGQIEFDRIIYNGIDTAAIPWGEQGTGYLLFTGRMAPEKGPELAIQIARQAGRRLVLTGGIYDRGFFERAVAPELSSDPRLDYRGHLRREEVYRLMSGADGVLFTSRWEEPFGLVIAESLAAGTPVIAWERGAAPEIVSHNRTGFLLPFGDIAGAALAVGRLGELDRAECRRQVETRFGLDKMLENYEAYYNEVIAGWRAH